MTRSALLLVLIVGLAAAAPLQELLQELRARAMGDGSGSGSGSGMGGPGGKGPGGKGSKGPGRKGDGEEFPPKIGMALFGLLLGECDLNNRVNAIEDVVFAETTIALLARGEGMEGMPTLDEVCTKLAADIAAHMKAQEVVEDVEKMEETAKRSMEGSGDMKKVDKVQMALFFIFLGECGLDERVTAIEATMTTVLKAQEEGEHKSLGEVCAEVKAKIAAGKPVDTAEEEAEIKRGYEGLKALLN